MIAKEAQSNFIKLVSLLNDGQCHDGNRLGDALQITRSAVWKMIKKLQQYGVPIISNKGQGYVLTEPLILLDSDLIQPSLPGEIDIKLFESIDSTNTYLKQFKGVKTPVICVSEQQTRGRGRFNRVWYSPFAQNIYLSCLYPFQKEVSELAGLSLITSLAIIKTLQEWGLKENLAVKWSNDVIFDGMKLAGNLIEVQAETHGSTDAVIGIGLNVNMLVDDSSISQQWISLTRILNQYIDRNKLCVRLVHHLITYLRKFEKTGFAFFKAEWDSLDYLKGKNISLKIAEESIAGRVLGINDQGYLLLQLPNGEIRVCSSGEA